MIDNSRVVLEDGIEYIVVDKIRYSHFSYVYLANANDEDDICVRKEILENGDCLLVGLSSDEEVENALKLYVEKNQEEE